MEGDSERKMKNDVQLLKNGDEKKTTQDSNGTEYVKEDNNAKNIKVTQIHKETQENNAAQNAKDKNYAKAIRDNQENKKIQAEGRIQIVTFRNDMRKADDDRSGKVEKEVKVIKIKRGERYDPHLKRVVKEYLYKKNDWNKRTELDTTLPHMQYIEGLGLSEDDFYFSDPDEERDKYLMECFVENEREYKLRLDSDLCKFLSEESNYFKSILKSDMIEKKSGFVKIPADEFPDFLNICRIVMGREYIEVNHFDDLCSLYIRANYYDIPLVSDVCRDILEKRICDRNAELISDLADEFGDQCLKDLVLKFRSGPMFTCAQSINADWGIEPIQADLIPGLGDEREAFNFYC